MERFPSPLDLRTRTCIFLQIIETQTDVSAAELASFSSDIGASADVDYFEDEDPRHLVISVQLKPAVSVSAKQLIEKEWKQVREHLAAAQRSICEKWSGSRLATRVCWEAAHGVLLR
jgi:hypothetical protein